MSRSLLLRGSAILLLVIVGGLILLALLPELISVDISSGSSAQPCAPAYIAIKNNGSLPILLRDWKLKSEGSGYSYILPDHLLLPGQTVRVWRGEGQNDAGNLYTGQADSTWPLNGLLLHGKILNTQKFFWTESCDLIE